MNKILITFCTAIAAFALTVRAQSPAFTDIPYSPSGNAYAAERCKLDIYIPDNVKEGCPTVVWFHGGGLTGGDKSIIPRALKESGYILVSANYRLIPRGGIADCISDAAAAVAWTFKHIEEYGGTPERIFVSGHSAGGYLTDMIGLDKRWLAAYGVDADRIAGLIPFSGQVVTHFAQRKAQGIGELQAVVDPFAPLYHVRADAPPIVIISGDREMELYGRYEETAYFWRMLKLTGHPDVHIYELQGYDHGNMAEPAVQILRDHITRLTKNKQD